MVVKSVQNIVVPKYMNEQFFANALEEGLREIRIKVQEINFEWGSNPGDNYCSSIYRVKVTYERWTGEAQDKKEQVSLIVKTIPSTEGTQFLEDVGAFVKEKLTYYDVLPRLEILGVGNKFGGRCFYGVKEPIQTIVFNDLTAEGFSVQSRQDKLDWDHSELLLQQLGRFHAASMDLFKKDPSMIERFRAGMLSYETVIKTDTYEQMFGGSLAYLLEIVANWPGYENIVEKLNIYLKNFKKYTVKFGALEDNDRIRVLNHGDLWTSNFMYGYENPEAPKKPTKVVFIDFQISFYGSPACDLNFFLNTSVKLDVLKARRNDLVAAYYKTFSETLAYLRYDKIPTFEDLQYELRNRELYGLFAMYGFLPMISLPQELAVGNNIDAMTDPNYKRKKFEVVFNNDLLQEQFKYALKRFEELGVFDVFEN